MLTKKIKNNTDSVQTWCGQEIEPDAYYEIQPEEEFLWAYNNDLEIAINDGYAVVCSAFDITSTNEALYYLRAIEAFASKYVVTAGEDLSAGEAVYISGSNIVNLSKADNENKLPCVGFVKYSSLSGSEVLIYTNDVLDNFVGLISGASYYLSQTTPGEIISSRPTAGIIVRVGVAKSETDLDIHIVRIPSYDIHLDGYSLKTVEDQRWIDSSQQRQDIRDTLDGYIDNLETQDLEEQVTDIQLSLDGYALEDVENQHWVDSSQQRQDIRDALDGYYVDGYDNSSYGTIYGQDDSGTNEIDISSADTWSKWNTSNIGEIRGTSYVTANTTLDRLIIGTDGPGKYLILGHSSLKTDSTATISMQLYKNGVSAGCGLRTLDNKNANQRLDLEFNGIIDLVENDYLELWFSSSFDNTTINTYYINLSIVRIQGMGVGDDSGSSIPSFTLAADQLLSPNNSDWKINAMAPLSSDSNNSAILVRIFDDTTEEGVGFSVRIPSGVTNIKLKFASRAETAPPGARTVGLKLYNRGIPDNGSVEAWSSGNVLSDIDTPTNENFQYDEETMSLSTLGVTNGEITQFELTRVNPVGGTELVGDWALLEIGLEFS